MLQMTRGACDVCLLLLLFNVKKVKGELGARVNTQLQPGNKLQVKVSCESLSSLSVCEREQPLWSLCVSSGATWTCFIIPSFRVVQSDSPPVVSTSPSVSGFG